MSKEEELGIEIIRKEGINFSTFKKEFNPLFEFAPGRKWDEDDYVWYYKCYAERRGVQHLKGTAPDSIKVWAEDFFQDWDDIYETGIVLKTAKKPKNARKKR